MSTGTSADSAALARRADQVQKGGARAAVLGINDGLVTNVCLILGVAGASATQQSVRLAGFVSLLAGAFSMAAGEWISVRAQVDLFEGVLRDLARMLDCDREVLRTGLRRQYESEGMDAVIAGRASEEVTEDPDRALQVTAREVVGMNPDELGSPWVAAGSSLALFSVGALVPLLPWFFLRGGPAIGLSVALTGAAGLVVGGVVGRSSGRGTWFGAARQLGIVVVASAVTYGLGKAFGTAVGG